MRAPSCPTVQGPGPGLGAEGFETSSPSSYWVLSYLPQPPFCAAALPTFLFLAPSTHLVQVDGMETHLSRSKLWELGQLLAPGSSWGHTAGTDSAVDQRHAPPPAPHGEGQA